MMPNKGDRMQGSKKASRGNWGVALIAGSITGARRWAGEG